MLTELTLAGLANPTALPVLGDHILETGWFDPRVCQVMWPLGPAPRHGYRTKKKRDRARIDREAHKEGYPLMFRGLAAAPTATFARAILAVLLFGEWRKRRWPLVELRRKKEERVPRGGSCTHADGVWTVYDANGRAIMGGQQGSLDATWRVGPRSGPSQAPEMPSGWPHPTVESWRVRALLDSSRTSHRFSEGGGA